MKPSLGLGEAVLDAQPLHRQQQGQRRVGRAAVEAQEAKQIGEGSHTQAVGLALGLCRRLAVRPAVDVVLDAFPTGLEARISQRFVDKPFSALEPDLVLDDQSDLRALGVDADLLPTPGHSPGSISMLFANGDAIIGDVLRGGILGGAFLAARPNYPFFLYDPADKRVILESVQRVLDAGGQRLFTGHGGPLPRPAVAQWLEIQRQQTRSGR